MVKGRHGKPQPKKGGFGSVLANRPTVTSDEPIFTRAPEAHCTDSPLLLTLLFRDKASQHSALARIEAFYESNTVEGNQYLTIDQAKSQKLCPNYEAFNFPISAVNEWLLQMKKCKDSMFAFPPQDEKESIDEIIAEQWWKVHCNEEEVKLLSYLDTMGCLEDLTTNSDFTSKSSNAPQYLISSLASQATSSLPHERLHFLYFASKEYRDFVENMYKSLSNKTRKIIEIDLGMRGYAKHVWQDEFQAYVSLNAAEFGNSTKQECTSLKQDLQEKQLLIWKQVAAMSV